jgi:hypothetical protein
MKTRIQENFTVQIWYGVKDQSETRIRLQHIRSGDTKTFLTFQELMFFIEHFVDDEIERQSNSSKNLK